MESSSVSSVFDRLTAVRDADLDSAAKLMLFVLVSYANKSGDAWPCNERLSADLQVSVRHVQRLVRQLVELKTLTSWMEGRKRVLRIDWQRLRSLAPTSLTSSRTSSVASTVKGDTDVMGTKRETTSMSPKGCRGSHPEHTNELSSSLKRESTSRKGGTDVTSPAEAKTQKRFVPDQLDTLIDAWNQLPDGIAPRCSKRSAPLVTAWQRATGQPDVAASLSDVAKLMVAIRDGSFLHGQPWFKFSWLFKSRSGESNAAKIVSGNYRDSNAKPRASAAHWQGDAADFDHLTPAAPAAAAAGASRELGSRLA